MSRSPFRGAVPDGLLYDPDHDMWVRRDGEEVVIGASAFGVFLAGEIIAFTSKPRGATVDFGRGMGTVECRKTVLAVHAPISFILLAGNDEAEERPHLINAEPYGSGWMARAQPTRWAEERSALMDAAGYRQHVLRIEPEARLD